MLRIINFQTKCDANNWALVDAAQQTSRYWPGSGFLPAGTACTVYSLTVSSRYWYCTVWYSQVCQFASTSRYKNNTALMVSGRYRYFTIWYSHFYQYLLVLADTKAVPGQYRYHTILYSQFYQFVGTSRYKNNTALP